MSYSSHFPLPSKTQILVNLFHIILEKTSSNFRTYILLIHHAVKFHCRGNRIINIITLILYFPRHYFDIYVWYQKYLLHNMGNIFSYWYIWDRLVGVLWCCFWSPYFCNCPFCCRQCFKKQIIHLYQPYEALCFRLPSFHLLYWKAVFLPLVYQIVTLCNKSSAYEGLMNFSWFCNNKNNILVNFIFSVDVYEVDVQSLIFPFH